MSTNGSEVKARLRYLITLGKLNNKLYPDAVWVQVREWESGVVDTIMHTIVEMDGKPPAVSVVALPNGTRQEYIKTAEAVYQRLVDHHPNRAKVNQVVEVLNG